jgi:hypothetical protein
MVLESSSNARLCGIGAPYDVALTAFALARSTLACWEGGAIDVRFHRDWASICRYILKEDKKPLVWGEYMR